MTSQTTAYAAHQAAVRFADRGVRYVAQHEVTGEMAENLVAIATLPSVQALAFALDTLPLTLATEVVLFMRHAPSHRLGA